MTGDALLSRIEPGYQIFELRIDLGHRASRRREERVNQMIEQLEQCVHVSSMSCAEGEHNSIAPIT